MVLPSGLMATLRTQLVCPSNVDLHSPVVRSHTLCRVGRFRSENLAKTWKHTEATHRTVLSPEPDTIVWPSTLTATLNTSPVCPFRVLLHSPDIMSQTLHNHKHQNIEQH